MSVYEKFFDKLKQNNIEVYPPNTHKGDVKSKYVVLSDGGRTQALNFTSQTILIDTLIYVPGTRFTDLDLFADIVKRYANELYPLIIPTGYESPAFYDDSINGWMKSIEYRYTIRNKYVR